MTRSFSSLALSALLLGAFGCGSDPVDAAGTYTIALTNQANECMLANWTEGDSTSNIEVVISQSGSSATADVGGLAGTYLDLILGSSSFNGEVDGDELNLLLIGTTEGTAPGCTYTVDAYLDAELDGDVLTGTITYRPNPIEGTCGVLETCSNVQAFNGTRPPSL